MTAAFPPLPSRVLRSPALTTVGFAVLYAAAVAVGRATRVDGSQLALVWPAAAVGVVWLATSWHARRRLAADAVVLLVLAGAINAATGTGLRLGLVFGVANLVQAGACCAVMIELQQRWDRSPWRLRCTADLWSLVVASLAGSLVAALIGPAALWWQGDADLLPAMGAWTLRNGSSTVALVAVALRAADHAPHRPVHGRRTGLELAAVSGVVTAGYLSVFGLTVHLPLAFLLVPLSMWIALRFSTTVAAAHVLLVGVFVVLLTLHGRGPFVLASPPTRVLLAQAFVAVTGLVTLVLALARDEREELILQLRRSTVEAERLAAERDEASRAKSAFLATMSHEIRTPLNGVLGLTDLLIGSDLPPQQADWARTAGRAGRGLLAIVNSVLDLSRVEAGAVELEDVDFDLLAVLDDALVAVRAPADETGLALVVAPSPRLARQRVGDPARLRQVLTNLLANAVKFTEQGSVTLTAGGDDSTVWVRVTDTGIGMSAEQQARLFVPFRQAEAATSRQYGGSGLGLAIASGLTEQMGGRITVCSTPGLGSTFSVDLPLPVAVPGGGLQPSVVVPVQVSREQRPLRVLLAEDNEINQMVAEATLQRHGVEVDVVADGELAVRAVATGTYDAVRMDCQMPGTDGLEATRRIRAAEAGTQRRLPVIAMTASAFDSDRDACLRAGMDGFLPKPWTPDQLAGVLDRLRAGVLVADTAALARPGQA